MDDAQALGKVERERGMTLAEAKAYVTGRLDGWKHNISDRIPKELRAAHVLLAALRQPSPDSSTSADAVEAMRERCARVAEEEANRIAVLCSDYPLGENLAAIPAAIRSLPLSQTGEG